jgi:putative sterol carrier protein
VSNIRYLSPEWIAAVAAKVEASQPLQALAHEHTVALTQVVTGTPDGDVTYHLEVRDGVAHFGVGTAPHEDVRFTESWDTAVAVSTGELNAQEAFIKGAIRFAGDHQRLIDAADVFAALNPVFDEVRAVVDYR